MKNFFYHLAQRFKYLLKGNFRVFWNYGEIVSTSLYYRGIPIIQRDEVPEDTAYLLNIPEHEWKENFLDWGKVAKDNPRRFCKIVDLKKN